MAAPMTERPCRLCHGILPKKQRRTIFGETFGVLDQLIEVTDCVPHQNDNQGKYVCGLCWNKLNRLAKVEKDIQTKLQMLNEERRSLVVKLRAMYRSELFVGKPPTGTPVSKKRHIIHSPTPRKIKKTLKQTPQRKPRVTTDHQAAMPALIKLEPEHGPDDVDKEKKRLQTRKSSKQLFSSDKAESSEHVTNDVKKEMICLTSTKQQSYLRKTSSDDLATFNMELWNSELQSNAPLLHNMISTIYEQSNPIAVAVTLAIILKQKNMHMSAFHHAVSQILDNGGATDECINLLNKLGLCVSASAMAKKKADLMIRQKSHVEQLVMAEKRAHEMHTGENTMFSSDIVGDNFDISKSPSHMSKEKQRKSFHWFMLVGLQKRVLNKELENNVPVMPITQVENSIFIPSVEECKSLENNFMFHIMKVLVKYLDCFKKYESHLPKYIDHPHIQEMSKKSDFVILDLLDKNENKSEDMISILEHIHHNYIPHTAEDHVIQKKVFGGDVLTNERAYSAQLAMLNGVTDFEQLAGVIHRPEGLHRMMNLCLIIYQQFYKASSTIDRGTLSQLRNIVHRVDVQGPDRVIDAYRAHSAFIDDCLDAFIVGACLHHLDMEDIGSEPKRKQVLFEAVSSEDKKKFLEDIASEIQKKYINLQNDLHTLEPRSQDLDLQEQQIKEMFHPTEKMYYCVHCHRSYKTRGHLKNHLTKEHNWEIHGEGHELDKSKTLDRVALYRASFMKCALLLRDTQDAYSMGDGNRITDNAKFQMLLSGIGHHTKYQLWLFRFLANCHCLLSPKDRYEYKWNSTTNLKGGTGHNIPNDNLVEILVHQLKVKLQAQGANVTYASAQKAAMTLQIQDEIKENMMEQCGMKSKGTSRSATTLTNDITLIANELIAENVFDYIPGRQYENFKNFNDLFSKVKIMELHTWITKQKDRLSYETI